MPYEFLADKDVDLSKFGYGDNLTFEFDKERCRLRVSVFEKNHFKDEIEIDLAKEFG